MEDFKTRRLKFLGALRGNHTKGGKQSAINKKRKEEIREFYSRRLKQKEDIEKELGK